MDIPEIIVGVLLLVLIVGVVFLLLQRTQPPRPVPNVRRPELERSLGRQSKIQRDAENIGGEPGGQSGSDDPDSDEWTPMKRQSGSGCRLALTCSDMNPRYPPVTASTASLILATA
jgi:hypothetical protein